MEKGKAGLRGHVDILGRVIMKDFTDEVISEQKAKGSENKSCSHLDFPVKGNSKYKHQ